MLSKNKKIKERKNLIVLEKDILEVTKEDLEGIDFVIHLAAITDMNLCLENPKKAYEVNVLGTIKLLENSINVKKFIHVSTLGVYGNPVHVPCTEEDPTKPIEPYAASKLASEYFVSSYCTQKNIPFSIARLFNVYGPGQSTKFIIPKIISEGLKGNILELNNLDTSRDFIYVKDVAKALITLTQKGKGIYNIGTGKETTIKEIVEIVEKVLGKKFEITMKKEGNKGVNRSQADVTKIEKETGWKYSINLQEGLKMTISSYKNG